MMGIVLSILGIIAVIIPVTLLAQGTMFEGENYIIAYVSAVIGFCLYVLYKKVRP